MTNPNDWPNGPFEPRYSPKEDQMKNKKRMKDHVKQLKKQTLDDRLGRIEEDQSTIIKTLGDLQDRFEASDADEEQVMYPGTPPNACPTVYITPSNVTGSPYDYLVIYLTPEGPDGPHIIVSDAKEFENRKGICVGLHEHYEDSKVETVVVNSAQEMIAAIRGLMDGKEN